MIDKFTLEDLLYLGQNPSDNLAAQIIVYRALGINKHLAISCMEELTRRRELGEEFNYEDYIEMEVKKFPVFESTNFSNLLKDFKL